MTRLLIGVLVGLAVGAIGAPANQFEKLMSWDTADNKRTELRAARNVAQLVGSAIVPPGKQAQARIYDCRPGRCEFTAQGTSRCDGTLRLRHWRADIYDAWFSRLRCR